MDSDGEKYRHLETDTTQDTEDFVNASGHVQELDRNFGFWSICSFALISDDAWGAGGGALVLALYNGGGPGVLYGLIAATVFYACIGVGLAELSSAIPSSANVYHFASVTAGPRYGRCASWFAGWWNCLAWIFGAASTSLFAANAVIAMYNVYHPEYEPERWQIFLAYLGIIWLDTAIVCFGQKWIAKATTLSGVLCMSSVLATILVCAIMPSYSGYGYASNAFVWTEWQNLTGWSSDGLVFLMGMLNGAYAIGTPDGVCHCCEEIPKPRTNIPKGIAAQLTVGFLTTFVFDIAVLYGVTSLDDVFNSNITSLPLAAMYQQATRSNAATFALLFLFTFNIIFTVFGAWIAAGRMLWTLSRDDATPFPSFVRRVSPTFRTCLNAQVLCTIVATILGLIYIGSETAFNAFVASFTIFTTLSYLVSILPHLMTGRRHVRPGPFWVPSFWAYTIMGIACAYIIVFNVLYMFPYAYPVAGASTMNWTSVIFVGFTILIGLGYLWKRTDGYVGPKVIMDAHDDILKGRINGDRVVTRAQ